MKLNELLLFLLIGISSSIHAQDKKVIILSELGLFSQHQDGSDRNTICHFKPEREITNPYLTANDTILGVISKGGLFGLGEVYSINKNTNQYTTLFHFKENSKGIYPIGNLINIDNALYGITTKGGLYNWGTLFRLNKLTAKIKIIHHFTPSEGIPSHGLTLGNNRELWGISTNTKDKQNPKSKIYCINIDGSNFKTFKFQSIIDSTQITLGTPSSPITHSKGYLWGSTVRRKSISQKDGITGEIYRIKDDGTQFQIIHSLKKENGYNSYYTTIPMVEYENHLWGTFFEGGKNNTGTLFKVSLDSLNFQTVFHFSNDYTNPYGEIKVKDQSIYGFTKNKKVNNQSTFFEFNLKTNTLLPYQDTSPNTTPFFTYNHNQLTVMSNSHNNDLLLHYIDKNSQHRESKIIRENPFRNGDHHINFYIKNDSIFLTTSKGGKNELGSIYQLQLNGTQLKEIYHFNNEVENRSNLVFYNNALWGINLSQSKKSTPHLFKINTETGDYHIISEALLESSNPTFDNKYISLIDHYILYTDKTNLIKFNILDNSIQTLTFPHSITSKGASFHQYDNYFIGFILGSNGEDFIVKINNNFSSVTVIHSFKKENKNSNGRYLNLPFVIKDDVLYGSTSYYGSEMKGVIFSINLKNNLFSRLYNFKNFHSITGLYDGGNNLFGINYEKQWGNSSFFSIDYNGENFKELFSCCFNQYELEAKQYPIIKMLFPKKVTPKVYADFRREITYGDTIRFSNDLHLPLKINSIDSTFFKLIDNNSVAVMDAGNTNLEVSINQTDSSFAHHQIFSISSSKSLLNIKPHTISTTYGSKIPNLSYSIEGFEFDDNEDSLKETIELTANTPSKLNPGKYIITGKNTSDIKYDIIYDSSFLHIDKAPLVIIVADTSKIYGAKNPNFTLLYDGFVNNENSKDLDSLPFVIEPDPLLPVGTYDLELKGGFDSNYQYIFDTGHITINKANLSIYADNKVKFFNEENPTLTLFYNGFIGDDTTDSLDVLPQVFTDATTQDTIGNYLIFMEGGHDNNYNYKLYNGTLTILKKRINISVNDTSKVYGSNNPEFTYIIHDRDMNYSYKNSIISKFKTTTSAHKKTDTGVYSVSIVPFTDTNYDFIFNNGKLIVKKNTAILAIDDKEIIYGENLPDLSYSLHELQFESDTNNISVELFSDFSITRDAGVYKISGITSSKNYHFNIEEGVLKVNKAPQEIINFSIPHSIQISEDQLDLSAESTSGLKIDFLSSDEKIVAIDESIAELKSTGLVSIIATQKGNKNYKEAIPITLDLTILPSTISSLNDRKTKPIIYPNPTSSYFYIDKAVEEVLIYNQQGILVKGFNAYQKDQKYNITDLPNGVYSLIIREGKKHEYCHYKLSIK